RYILPGQQTVRRTSGEGSCSGLISLASHAALLPEQLAGRSARATMRFFSPLGLERPSAASDEQQKDETQKHGQIRASFMQRSPKPALLRLDRRMARTL